MRKLSSKVSSIDSGFAGCRFKYHFKTKNERRDPAFFTHTVHMPINGHNVTDSGKRFLCLKFGHILSMYLTSNKMLFRIHQNRKEISYSS